MEIRSPNIEFATAENFSALPENFSPLPENFIFIALYRIGKNFFALCGGLRLSATIVCAVWLALCVALCVGLCGGLCGLCGALCGFH